MTYYTIRITPDDIYPAEEVLKILNSLKIAGLPWKQEEGRQYLDSLLVARETDPRLHFHIRIHTTQCRASVYKYKTKWFPLWKTKGNAVWSTHDCSRCKKHDECSERGLWYVCKDGDIVIQKGYTPESIALAIERGSSIKEEVQQKRPSVADRIIKFGKWEEGVVPSGRELVDAMIRYYNSQNRQVPSRYEETLHSLAMKLNPAYLEAHYYRIQDNWDRFYIDKFHL